jgi:hypothetical protein
MKKGKTLGIIIGVIGASLTILSIYAANYLSGVKGKISGISNMFGGNKVVGFLGGAANKKISAYDNLITGCFWIGILLLVVGIIIFFLKRKSK